MRCGILIHAIVHQLVYILAKHFYQVPCRSTIELQRFLDLSVGVEELRLEFVIDVAVADVDDVLEQVDQKAFVQEQLLVLAVGHPPTRRVNHFFLLRLVA